jgi:hypothetical protein
MADEFRQKGAINEFLTLYFLREMQRRKMPTRGKTRLQKLVFLCELSLHRQSLVGFYHRFFRLHLGPFSKDLANLMLRFVQAGLVHSWSSRTTGHVSKLIDEYAEVLAPLGSNGKILTSITACIEEHGGTPRDELMAQVYEIVWTPIHFPEMRGKIRDLPSAVDLLDPARDEGTTFRMTDEYAEMFREELALPEPSPEETRQIRQDCNRIVEKFIASLET